MQIIHIGDSMPLDIEWVIPSAENPYQTNDAVIIDARVTVIRNKDRKVIVDNEAADVDGNETVYVLHDIQSQGLHTALVTAVFNDEITLTQSVEFYVK